jgi:hypothetical protein
MEILIIITLDILYILDYYHYLSNFRLISVKLYITIERTLDNSISNLRELSREL